MFEKKHKKDMSKDKRALQKLRREVEKTKRALSSTHQARLEIEVRPRASGESHRCSRILPACSRGERS